MVLKYYYFQDVDEIKQCNGAFYGEFLKVPLKDVSKSGRSIEDTVRLQKEPILKEAKRK